MEDSIDVRIPKSRDDVLCALRFYGATVIRDVVSEQDVKRLYEDALALTYTEQPKEYGRRKVRQDVSSAHIPEGSLLWRLGDGLQSALVDCLGADRFSIPLDLNHRNTQRYPDGSYGIGTHLDEKRNINLILLYGVSGYGRFKVYKKRGGHLRTLMEIVPGSVLVMVAPGYEGRDVRPAHGVDQIRGDRIISGYRQTERGKYEPN